MISIIMPLYNAEKYLIEAIESIFNQTYKDFELIIINDASTDGTNNILSGVVDDRVFVMHNKERMGAAFSRNTGIDIAKGDYVSFLDGDDIFLPEMLETAYKCAIDNDLDVVVFEEIRTNTDGMGEIKSRFRSKRFYELHSSKPFDVTKVTPGDYSRWNNGPCNKLIKREFLNNNALRFQNLTSQNDVYFVEMAFLFSKRMMFLEDSRIMLYARAHDAVSRISNNRNPINVFYAFSKVLDDLIQKDEKTLFCYAYYKFYHVLAHFMQINKGEELRLFLQTEGLDSLLKYDEILEDMDSDMFSLRLTDLVKNVSVDGLEHVNLLNSALDSHQNELLSMIDKCNNCVIWGAGKTGQIVLKHISPKNRLKVKLVDTNAVELICVDGFNVYLPLKELLEDADLIILTMAKIGDDILNKLKNVEDKVVYAIDYC